MAAVEEMDVYGGTNIFLEQALFERAIFRQRILLWRFVLFFRN